MKLSLLALTFLAAPTLALAGPTCSGDADMKPMWQIAKSYEMSGHTIKLMKVTKGGCYEIYGYENGEKVETYFDPRSGEVLEKH